MSPINLIVHHISNQSEHASCLWHRQSKLSTVLGIIMAGVMQILITSAMSKVVRNMLMVQELHN